MNKTISLLIAIYLVSLVSCDMDSHLFNPEKLDSYTLPGNTIPDSLIEPVTLQSNGKSIYGYWVAAGGIHPGITILYNHGNKHHLDYYWDRVMLLYELGCNVFIYDYKGFGMSEGESSEEEMHYDAEAALDFVLNVKETSRDSLVLYGFSLGNVASIYLTSEKIVPMCLIAEAPFASANSLTQGAAGLDLPPLWLTQGEFNNAEKIKNINARFLLFHGEDDDFVRYIDNGKIVYENAPAPKKLLLIPDAGHSDIPNKMGTDNYLKALSDWIFKGEL